MKSEPNESVQTAIEAYKAEHVVKPDATFEGDSPVLTTDDLYTSADIDLSQEFGWDLSFARQVLIVTSELMGGRTGSRIISDGPGGGEVLAMMRRSIRLVRCSNDLKELADKLSYLCLALRWYDELDGIDNSADLARHLKVTKANATKYVMLFRDVSPPGLKTMTQMPGQRSDEDRAKFAQICRDRAAEKNGWKQ